MNNPSLHSLSEDTVQLSCQRSPTFYKNWHWGQTLSLLRHLCQYSRNPIVVTGESGSGKSTLIRALQATERSPFIFCLCDAAHLTQVADFTQALAEAFNYAWEPDAPMEALVRGLGAQVKRQTRVVLIDNAERLEVSILTFMLTLAVKLYPTVGAIHLLLFGQPKIEQLVAQTKFYNEQTAEVQYIELEPLTLAEMEGFIRHQWQVTGNRGPLPFDKAELKKIYSLSKGSPGKVEQTVRSLLAGETLPTMSNKADRVRQAVSPLAVGMAVTLSILLLVLSYFWPTPTPNTPGEEVARAIQKAPKPVPSAVTPAPKALASRPDEVAPELLASMQAKWEAELSQKLGRAHTLQLEQVDSVRVTAEQKLADLEAEHQQLQANLQVLQQELQQSQQALVEAQLAKAQPRPKPIPTPIPRAPVFSLAEKHLLQQPKAHYTLQLLGASQKSRVETFINTTKLPEPLRYYQARLKGQPWYIVVYGTYPTRQQAMEALAKMPSGLRALKPWPRVYQSIHNSLNKRK